MKTTYLAVILIFLFGCKHSVTKPKRFQPLKQDPIVSKIKRFQPLKQDTIVSTVELPIFLYVFMNAVIKEKKINVKYSTKVYIPDGILACELTYIGSIQNTQGEQLDFLYTKAFEGNGFSHLDITGMLAIYKNQKNLGFYFTDRLPSISNNKLALNPLEDCNRTTWVEFKDSIPSDIFEECTLKNGEAYGNMDYFHQEYSSEINSMFNQDTSSLVDVLEQVVFARKEIRVRYHTTVGEPDRLLDIENTYLGSIKNREGEEIEFVFVSTYDRKKSKYGNSSIHVYLYGEKYGFYDIGICKTLPFIAGNHLSIGPISDDCDLITELDFRDGLPYQDINIRCTDDMTPTLYEIELY